MKSETSSILPGPSKHKLYSSKSFRKRPWMSSLSVFTVLGLVLLVVTLTIELPPTTKVRRSLPKIDFSNPESEIEVNDFRTSLLRPPNTSLDSAVVEPSDGNDADSVVFFVHGLGGYIDTGVVDAFRSEFPNTRWVFPQAPSRPVYLAHNRSHPSWYDIRAYKELNTHLEFPPYTRNTPYDTNDYGFINQDLVPRDSNETFPERESLSETSNSENWSPLIPYWEDNDGLIESTRAINELVAKHVGNGTGLISPKRWIMMGFSQGGVMSQLVGLTAQQPPAGISVLSSYFPMRQHPKRLETYPDIPILFCHGDIDPILDYNLARYSVHMYDNVLNYKNVQLVPIPDMVHMYGAQDEWSTVISWMKTIL